MPPHSLRLKVGCPVVLLRNLNLREGLANGPRLIILRIHRYNLEAIVASGPAAGKTVAIPRIPLTPGDRSEGIHFTRLQFPVVLAFAMTINKAQGQTLQSIGIFLSHPCFSHGQLYVALSRVGRPDNVHILLTHKQDPAIEAPHTANVVYKEIFDEDAGP